MKLVRYKKKKISTYVSRTIILIIISLILSFLVIKYFSKQTNNILKPMAISKAERMIAVFINNSVIDVNNYKELINIDKNSNDEIGMITYNSYEVNKYMGMVTQNIQKRLIDASAGGIDFNEINDNSFIIAKIPFGVIFNNVMLANVGPKINVKLEIVGNILSQIETEVKPYGINNAYVEMRVYLEVNARVVLPFASENIKISNTVPISMNIIQGKIPEAYISTYK